MRQNYKFHAIALTGICAAITAVYFLLAPKTPQPSVDGSQKSELLIEVYSATWGLECNDYIREQSAAPLQRNEKGEIVPHVPVALVTENNVLPIVSEWCNGKLSCDVSANSKSLESEPIAACLKKLNIKYRCFSFDSLRSLVLEENQTGKIDCEKDISAPAAANAPQQ